MPDTLIYAPPMVLSFYIDWVERMKMRTILVWTVPGGKHITALISEILDQLLSPGGGVSRATIFINRLTEIRDPQIRFNLEE